MNNIISTDPIVTIIAETEFAHKQWLSTVEEKNDDCPELEDCFYALEDKISETIATTPEGMLTQLQYAIKQLGPERECTDYCIEVLKQVESALNMHFRPNSAAKAA